MSTTTMTSPVAIKGMFTGSAALPARKSASALASGRRMAKTVVVASSPKAARAKVPRTWEIMANGFKAKPAAKNVKVTKKQPVRVAEKGTRGIQLNMGGVAENPVRLTLGWTAANELFVGRMAMIGFTAAIIGEAATGLGPIAQLTSELGLGSMAYTDEILVGLAVANGLVGLLPASGEYVADPEEKVQARFRSKGSLQDPKISMLQPKKFFGITEVGFTKPNELFVGRVAQLGFAAAAVGEAVTGKGVLGQLGIETGLPTGDFPVLLTAFAGLMLFGALGNATYPPRRAVSQGTK